jgi:hypothetical protein
MVGTPEHQRLREQVDEETKQKFGAERVQELMARRRGSINDGSSIGPGATVIFRDFKPEKNGTMLEILARCGIEGARATEGMDSCCTLELPEGGYADDGGGIKIYKKVGPGGEIDEGERLTTQGWAFILRVEGANGELLQNHSYQPDGNPVHYH